VSSGKVSFLLMSIYSWQTE